MRKKPIRAFLITCLVYSISFFASKLLLFLGSLQLALFSQWSNIFGLILEFPSSKFDIAIMAFRLDWIIIGIGTAYFVYCFYNMFNSKI
jgi:hypothetical protein